MYYDYECIACHAQYELEQSIKEDSNPECQVCKQQTAKRLITGGTGFLLSNGGVGWGKNGYST